MIRKDKNLQGYTSFSIDSYVFLHNARLRFFAVSITVEGFRVFNFVELMFTVLLNQSFKTILEYIHP